MAVNESEIEEQPVKTEGHAFIIRIWRQKAGGAEKNSVWRGSIDHVGAGERLYFSDLAAIDRFIQDRTEIGANSQTSRWRRLLGGFTKWIKS
jgi:hypothetical protein